MKHPKKVSVYFCQIEKLIIQSPFSFPGNVGLQSISGDFPPLVRSWKMFRGSPRQEIQPESPHWLRYQSRSFKEIHQIGKLPYTRVFRDYCFSLWNHFINLAIIVKLLRTNNWSNTPFQRKGRQREQNATQVCPVILRLASYVFVNMVICSFHLIIILKTLQNIQFWGVFK